MVSTLSESPLASAVLKLRIGFINEDIEVVSHFPEAELTGIIPLTSQATRLVAYLGNRGISFAEEKEDKIDDLIICPHTLPRARHCRLLSSGSSSQCSKARIIDHQRRYRVQEHIQMERTSFILIMKVVFKW